MMTMIIWMMRIDDEFEEERPAKKHFFKKNDSFDEDDDFQDDFKIKEARKTKAPAPKVPVSERPRQIKTQPVTSSKVSPIRPRKSSGMEVCVIKPEVHGGAREITETLLGGCTVVLNMESWIWILRSESSTFLLVPVMPSTALFRRSAVISLSSPRLQWMYPVIFRRS